MRFILESLSTSTIWLTDAALDEQSAVPMVTEASFETPSIDAPPKAAGPADRNPRVVVVTTNNDRRALDRERREEREGSVTVAADASCVVNRRAEDALFSLDCDEDFENDRVSERWRQGALCPIRMGRQRRRLVMDSGIWQI